MKKYLLVAGVTLFTTAAVTATVLTTNSDKKVTTEKKVEKKKGECGAQKKECGLSKLFS